MPKLFRMFLSEVWPLSRGGVFVVAVVLWSFFLPLLLRCRGGGCCCGPLPSRPKYSLTPSPFSAFVFDTKFYNGWYVLIYFLVY